MIQSAYNFNFALIDDKGLASLAFRQWMTQASLSIPIVGTGSPEGVVEAAQYRQYLDSTGSAGNISYRKMLPDIAGDVTKGWVKE